eukprot:TRINITY_DN2733_c0_g1_i4.p1 TRINITY_DN2733_c0_g1~~TRINITY_DN2733_c0_g1_i4.p1  ORF type:complete len:220 (+),score=70.53 TRINITY_DN2733_c0_g1_i4:85-744(+)
MEVDFYYDVISPYSYFAYLVFKRYIDAKIWDIKLRLHPVFLGGIMQGTGNQPPATLPARGKYLFKDIARNGQYFGAPVQFPPNFPIMTIKALRLLTVLETEAPDLMEKLSVRCWSRYWGEKKDIGSVESVLEACKEIGIEEEQAKKWIQRSEENDIKEKLKNKTDQVIQNGAFGAPTWFVTKDNKKEMYFGSDRFAVFATLYQLPWYGPNPSSSMKSKL